MNNLPLKIATLHLKKGGIIAYPTEAVFGLGCDPQNQTALIRLLTLKQRNWQKGLILIAAQVNQLEPYIEPLTPALEQQVFASWPGPVTWLLPAKKTVSHWLRGTSNKIAVRITAHPVAAALCQHWQGALVSTSANISQRPPARTALQVRKTFSTQIDYILPGQVGGLAQPTSIRDALTHQIIR